MPLDLMLLIVVGTSVWVFYDAGKRRVSITSRQPYSLNTGAWAWLASCLLLWIVSFPYYLVRRSGSGSSPLDRQGTHWSEVAAPSPATYCPQCGVRLTVGGAYCPACGRALRSQRSAGS